MGVSACVGRELPITGSKQVLEEQLVGMTKILNQPIQGALGFQRTLYSSATGDSHRAKTEEASTQRLRDLLPTGLPLLGGHLKTQAATAHLLCQTHSCFQERDPWYGVPATECRLPALRPELSPLVPFYAQNAPPTRLLQAQPERVALRSCAAHLLPERALASPTVPH